MSLATVAADYLPWDDPQFIEYPYPWYARLQRDHPILQSDEHTFIVSKYRDIMEHLRKPTMHTANAAWVTRDPWDAWANTALLVEPPEHTRLRRLTNKWFTPKLVRDWVETTRLRAAEALDAVGDDGRIDAHMDLGILPAHATMCEILGLPDDDLAPVAKAMHAAMITIGFVHTGEQLDDADRGFAYINDRVARMIADRRIAPGDRLVDALNDAHERGEISEAELVQTVAIFYAQGSPNSAYLIASGVLLFAERPDLFAEYRNHPEVRAAFINELVRLHPVEMSVTRFTSEDTEIGGVHIPANSKIQFMLAAANRDPEVFTDPDAFDYSRSGEASRNLSFGTGAHSCAGQVIARAEAEAVLTLVTERITHIELDGDPRGMHTERFRTFAEVPVRVS